MTFHKHITVGRTDSNDSQIINISRSLRFNKFGSSSNNSMLSKAGDQSHEGGKGKLQVRECTVPTIPLKLVVHQGKQHQNVLVLLEVQHT
jgi:hypothetical protein